MPFYSMIPKSYIVRLKGCRWPLIAILVWFVACQSDFPAYNPVWPSENRQEMKAPIGPILFVSFHPRPQMVNEQPARLYSMNEDGGNVHQISSDTERLAI